LRGGREDEEEEEEEDPPCRCCQLLTQAHESKQEKRGMQGRRTSLAFGRIKLGAKSLLYVECHLNKIAL
jgi:hypothetical protein